MANSFGGTIKLTGEGEYKKSLKDITSDLKLMSSEMKVMATSTDKSSSASEADRLKRVALSKAIDEQRAKLGDLNKQLQDSVGKNGETSDASKRLQTQVNNTTANLNKMEGQLKGTGTSVGTLGTDMDGTGKKASVFGDVLKANLASDIIVGGVKKIAEGVKAVSGAFVGLVGESIKAYADYEQLIGGIETLFKGSAGTIEGYATGAYKTAGLSANKYMEMATSFSASLLQGLGGDTAKASEATNLAITDMSDNANKMGTDVSLIQNAYQGFAKDNYTMLDNLKLGYGGTATEMARLVNDSGVMGGSFKATAENVKDIPFDQLINAIHKTQTEMGITGTTAKEASTTISGSLNSVKASWENVLSSFAGGNNEAIAGAIGGLIESAGNLATNVTAILPQVVEGIGQLAQGLVEQIPTIVTTLLPPLLTSLQGLIQSVVTIIPQLIPIVVQLLTTLVNVLLQNLPMLLQAGIDILLGLVAGISSAIPTLIPAIVQAIGTILDVLIQNLPAILEAGIVLLVALVEGITKAIPTLTKMIPRLISTIVEVLLRPDMIFLLLNASLRIILALAMGLVEAIPSLIAYIPRIISSIINAIGSAMGQFGNIGGQMINGLVEGFKGGIARAKQVITDSVKKILGKVAEFLGIHSPSRYMADMFGTNMAKGIGVGFGDEMGSVADGMNKSLADALPSSINTDVALNSSGLASSIANANSLASSVGSDNLLGAIQQAFKSVKIELDDKKVGDFVIGTVERAIY